MRERSPSIIKRIVWLHLAALAGMSLAISAAVYFLLNATLNNLEERLLRDHAVDVARHLDVRDGNWRLELPADLQAIYAKGYGGYALDVVAGDGTVIYSSLPHGAPFPAAGQGGSQKGFFSQSLGSSVYYGVTMPVSRKGREAVIQVVQNQEHPDVIVDDVVSRFLGRIAWFVVPIFALLLAIDLFLMRATLAPVVAASRVVSTIVPGSHIRLPIRGLPREIMPLVLAVNGALERLDSAIRAQREFTADAAHELRTPLAVLRMHADTELDEAAARTFRGDIDAMGRIVDQLLELAELEGLSVGSGDRIDLNQLAANVIAAIAPIALGEGKSMELIARPGAVHVVGNFEMLFRAIRNVLENAVRYSPAGGNVEVEIASGATVLIKDRGLGIHPADRPLVFQRFWRKNRQDREHSGLGLAIVAKIVQLHGGLIEVLSREGGGTIFRIALPPAP